MTTILWTSGAVLIALTSWYTFWRIQARNFGTSGYVSPETSWFAKLCFAGISRLVGFLTVGPITVIGAENVPRDARIIGVGNHQVKADFAVAQRAFGRHFRSLGAAAQFPGITAMLAAWLGVIPVTYGSKEERAHAEQACVSYLGGSNGWRRLSLAVVLILSAVLTGAFVYALCVGAGLGAMLSFLALCAVLSFPGGARALLVAPQGALMPDNQLNPWEFRAGAVRMARCAVKVSRERVLILPLGVLYKRDPKDAHWTHRFLKRTRSMFLGMRNPVYWNPLFKLDLNKLSAEERADVEAERAQALYAYEHSHITCYGAVVVVGKPIDPNDLAADPVEAIEQIRLIIVDLLEEAAKH